MKKRVLPYLLCSIIAFGTAPCMYANKKEKPNRFQKIALLVLVAATTLMEPETPEECANRVCTEYHTCMNNIPVKMEHSAKRQKVNKCWDQYNKDSDQCPQEPTPWWWPL